MTLHHALPPLPSQSPDTAWPTRKWIRADLPTHSQKQRLHDLISDAFEAPVKPALTGGLSLVVIQDGKLVYDKYANGFSATDTYPSWSMAKSITHALVGIAVKQGLLDIYQPADVDAWQGDGDARKHITLDALLRMSSGLKFVEDYVDGEESDVIKMLYGEGKDNVAAYAASRPLLSPPDTVCSYASGTTNIIAQCLTKAVNQAGQEMSEFMSETLFKPIGMMSAMPKFDPSGTFIGSSFCFCSSEDFARFGLLYLRDGIWAGSRILPEGWVDYGRTPGPVQPDEALGYGAHWWLGMAGPGSFSANGYQGQYTLIVPEDDLIVVRNGRSPLEYKDRQRDWTAEIASCFKKAK